MVRKAKPKPKSGPKPGSRSAKRLALIERARRRYCFGPTPIGLRELAKEVGLTLRTLATYSSREQWPKVRQEFFDEVEASRRKNSLRTLSEDQRNLESTAVKTANKHLDLIMRQIEELIDSGRIDGKALKQSIDSHDKVNLLLRRNSGLPERGRMFIEDDINTITATISATFISLLTRHITDTDLLRRISDEIGRTNWNMRIQSALKLSPADEAN